MRRSFCFLEKNKKTFKQIQDYYSAIKCGKPAILIDCSIQYEEIESYLHQNNLTMDNQEAIRDWIQANSSQLRSYLNSLKMVAFFLFTVSKSIPGSSKDRFSYTLFCRITDLWNERKINFIDTVFL